MILPYGSNQSSEFPVMTGFLIAVCTVLHLIAAPGPAFDKAVDSFCKSTQGNALTDYMKRSGALTGKFMLSEEEQCEWSAILIGTHQAADMIESSTRLTPEEKQEAGKMVTRAERRLDYSNWRLMDPKHPSLITFITSTFFHAGWVHLIGNMLFLWLFGRILEDQVGPANLLLIFVGAGLAADVAYMLLSWVGLAAGLPTLGASAGIYGVMGGVWRKCKGVKIHAIFWMFTYVRPIEIPAWILIAFYGLGDIFSIFTHTSGGVNSIAHVAGFLIIYLLLPEPARIRSAVDVSHLRADMP